MEIVCLRPEQQVVVDRKIKDGYDYLGVTQSTLNGLSAFVLSKGKSLLVINTLGYNEHYIGKTWNIT